MALRPRSERREATVASKRTAEAVILLWLRADIRRVGSLRKMARKIGLSPTYLSRVLSGAMPVGPARADYYGYVRRWRWVRAAGGEG